MESSKSIADFCPEFQDWVNWINNPELKLTGNQAKFANFLLENKDIVGSIGDMEVIFKSVRNFLRKPYQPKNEEVGVQD